jgi:7-carboxy-7-deazaguanine synthase
VKTYRIKEIFHSIQGEGYWSGSPAVFVRFAGCNVWSGHDKDRERDTARGVCAAWCDTNFVGGETLSAADIVARVEVAGSGFVVMTGGEPGLQLDLALVNALAAVGRRVHVETNGSVRLPGALDWVTLSPKPPMPVVAQRYDEVKVIYPAVEPSEWERYAPHRFVQPLSMDPNAMGACAAYVLRNPTWRLSLQTHKVMGLR